MAITNSAGVVVHIDSPNSPGADDSRSVHLVRDNTLNYGEVSNQNFYRVTENFASDTAPGQNGSSVTGTPLQGQFWYHKSQKNLRILVEDDNSLNNWKSIVKEGDSTELNELTTRGDTILGTDSSEAVTIRGTTRITAPTNIAGDLTLEDVGRTKSNLTVPGNLTLGGNLEITGEINSQDVNTLSVDDNRITLNAGVSGTPSLDAIIEVERGDNPNSQLIWDENTSKWRTGLIGGNLSDILLDSDTNDNDSSGNSIVRRNSGNFTAGTITASLDGNANTATTVAGISDHNIEGLRNVIDTDRDADNKWLKWNNTDSRYEPGVIAIEDLPDIRLGEDDVTGILPYSKGGTGNSSNNLTELKAYLGIPTPVNRTRFTNQTLSPSIGSNRVNQSYESIRNDQIHYDVVQIIHTEKNIDVWGGDYGTSDGGLSNWVKEISFNNSNVMLTDICMFLKCATAEGGYAQNEWVPIENFHGWSNEATDEQIYTPISVKITEADGKYNIFLRRNGNLGEGFRTLGDRVVTNFLRPLTWDNWRLYVFVYGGRY